MRTLLDSTWSHLDWHQIMDTTPVTNSAHIFYTGTGTVFTPNPFSQVGTTSNFPRVCLYNRKNKTKQNKTKQYILTVLLVSRCGIQCEVLTPAWRKGGNCTWDKGVCPCDLTSPQGCNYHFTCRGNDRAGLGSPGLSWKFFFPFPNY